MKTKKIYEDEKVRVNLNYEETESNDSSSVIIAYVFLFALFISAALYLAPWFTSISSVFKLILTCVCGTYVYQCLKTVFQSLRDV